jgi:hypothetical protein
MQVLRTYVHNLRNLPLAEAYCHKIHSHHSPQSQQAQQAQQSGGNAITDNQTHPSADSTSQSSSSSSSSSSSAATGSSGYGLKTPASSTISSKGGDKTLGDELEAHGCVTIYQLLVKVMLAPPQPPPSSPSPSALSSEQQWSAAKAAALDDTIAFAERCLLDSDRLDPVSFLAMLPRTVPLSRVQRYLSGALENTKSKKRNLQVVYQLLRVREVNLRTAATSPGVGVQG